MYYQINSPSSRDLSWSTFLGELLSSRVAFSSPETSKIPNIIHFREACNKWKHIWWRIPIIVWLPLLFLTAWHRRSHFTWDDRKNWHSVRGRCHPMHTSYIDSLSNHYKAHISCLIIHCCIIVINVSVFVEVCHVWQFSLHHVKTSLSPLTTRGRWPQSPAC